MFGWFRKYVRKIGIFGVEIEFHPPTAPAASNPALPPTTHGNSDPAVGDAVRTEEGHGAASPATSSELTFDAVIRAIRERYPEAALGRTAEHGQYFERARHLTNFQMHTSDPPYYKAYQPNGKFMWLYLGKGGKICCGDKE